ncbi:hypothetical protein FA10DRAFT_17610 [Acaromyces ingoldii]|uniref:Uncharacterized protein n=1 Tax=Acaromyces ingoldii TaxID=215250 RepID=A0A316YVP4_9BASI|nr:hypothetical protein FA10DRAFT_17610 [Acaromyces ingoldii]PWN93261.1 hypothetical protein FA10DRAFT_17610 [Acaromyces ingoldii]
MMSGIDRARRRLPLLLRRPFQRWRPWPWRPRLMLLPLARLAVLVEHGERRCIPSKIATVPPEVLKRPSLPERRAASQSMRRPVQRGTHQPKRPSPSHSPKSASRTPCRSPVSMQGQPQAVVVLLSLRHKQRRTWTLLHARQPPTRLRGWHRRRGSAMPRQLLAEMLLPGSEVKLSTAPLARRGEAWTTSGVCATLMGSKSVLPLFLRLARHSSRKHKHRKKNILWTRAAVRGHLRCFRGTILVRCALLSEDEDAGEEQVAPFVADGGGTAARFRMRRSATYRNPEAQAQRRRNRAALVMADGFAASANDADGQANAPASSVMGAVNARAAAEGWTLIEQRPRSPVRVTTSEVNEPPTLRTMDPIGTYTDQRTSSPVRETADEGSENVTTWFRDPAQPSRWLSTSPGPMGRSSLPPLASSAARSETNPAALPQRRGEISLSRRRTTDVDDPRTTRRPRRLASLTDDVVRRVESILDQQSAANLSRTLDIDDNDERVPQIAPQAPLRERQSSSPRPIPRHFTRERQDEFWGRSLREDTPPPEERRGDEEGNGDRQDTLAATSAQIALLHQRAEASLRQSRRLTDMGVRLEQEFRARQDELRVREERLRLEVARRRAEVDALRQREGRIGRVLSGRSEATEEPEAARQRLEEEREPLLGGEAGEGGGGQPPSPTSPSGSSLVRRRSVRESGLGPMTRSYIRLLQDGHIASSRMTRRSVEMPHGAQAPRRRANSSPSVEEADRPQFLAAAPAPASAGGRPGTKDDLVVADASQMRSPRVFTPLLTDEDKAKLGQSGLALMRLVDEAAGPTVKKLIMHAKLKRLAMQWTPMQPDLPDTLEGGAEYPLRFQARVVRHYGKGDEAKIDSAQCILTKDESGLECNAGKDEIVLRFLAAVVGRSTPAAEPTSVTAGRVPTSQRDARLAASPPGYMTLLQRHREARLEDRDWARARERIIGQANNVDARRRALGLPPRDAVRPAPAPTTNAASRSEADIVFEHQQQQQQQPVPLERDGGAPSEDDDVEGWSMHEGAPGTRHCAGEEEKQLPSVALSSDQWRLIEHVKGRARSRISPARRLEAGDADTLKASDFVPIVCGNVGMAGRLLVEDRAVSLARAQTKREEEEEPKGRAAKENTFSLGQIVIQVDVPRARWSAGSGWTAKEAKRVKGLVFVESSSQRLDERLAEYRRVETVDDFKMLAKKMTWSVVDGLESIGEEARKRKVAKAPWRVQSFDDDDDDDDDESLGDPFAVEKAATKSKDKNKGKGATITVAPPAAVFETDARGRASVFASGDNDGQIEKRRLEGSYIGITLLRDEHESSDDKYNIKVLWVEAFGQAGRRSFGAASLR